MPGRLVRSQDGEGAAVTQEQIEAVLAHLQLLTSRLFAISGVDDKVALMMSLQDVMSAFEVET